MYFNTSCLMHIFCLPFAMQFFKLVHAFGTQFCLILTYKFSVKRKNCYFQYGFFSIELTVWNIRP